MGVARACGRETLRAGVAPEPRGDAPVPPAGWALVARLVACPPARFAIGLSGSVSEAAAESTQ